MLQAQIFTDKHAMMGTQMLSEFILQFLIKNGIRGATVFEGSLGYGINQHIHNPNALFSFDETPMMVVFIDTDVKVKNVLTALRQIWKGGLITTAVIETFDGDGDTALSNNSSFN